MKINHTVAHYLIGTAALGLAGYANVAPAPVQHEAAVHEIQRPSKFDWASLPHDEIQALGNAMKGQKPGNVTIFCRDATCHDLELGFDDAFEIAGWDEALQTLPVDSEEDRGVFVGPPGPAAEYLAAEIREVAGIEPKIVPIDGIDGVGIIIGKTGDRK